MKDNKIKMEWTNAPTPRRHSKWGELLAPLRVRPGQWARFGPMVGGSAHSQARSLAKRDTLEGFVFVSRIENRVGYIYACYKPSES